MERASITSMETPSVAAVSAARRIVFTVEPTFFCAPLTLFIAKSAGAACWLHVQDFEVDAAFDLGVMMTLHRKAVAQLADDERPVTVDGRIDGHAHRGQEGMPPARAVPDDADLAV